MVSKDRSFSAPVASRKPSSLATTSSSSAGWPRRLGRHPVQEARRAPRRRGCGPGGRPRSRRRSCRRGAGRWGRRRAPPRRRPAPAPRNTRPTTGRDRPAPPAAAGRSRQRAPAAPPAAPAHPVAEPGRQLGRHLGRVEEQPRRAVGVQDRWRQRQRRADHVAAADVEQPGDRGRRGDHARVGAPGRPGSSPTRARLAAEASPAYCRRVRHHRRRAAAAAGAGPGRVQRIGRRPASAPRRPWPRRPSAAPARRGCAGAGRSRWSSRRLASLCR